MTRLELPVIHLNGTSKESLEEGYESAVRAVRKAIEALEDAGPNARDYYPQGDRSFRRAAEQHAERLKVLGDVRADLETIWLHIVDS